MEQAHDSGVISIDQQSPREWAKLLRKLRWVGLDEEARHLELALSTLPAEQRGGVLVESSSTD
jgi:hypothetical protein